VGCFHNPVEDCIGDPLGFAAECASGVDVERIEDGVLLVRFFHRLEDAFGLPDVGIPHDFDRFGDEDRSAVRFHDQRHGDGGELSVLLKCLVQRGAERFVNLCHVLRPAEFVDVDHGLQHQRQRDVLGKADVAVDADVERDVGTRLRRIRPPHEQARLVPGNPGGQVLYEVSALTASFAAVVVVTLRKGFEFFSGEVDDELHDGDLVDHAIELCISGLVLCLVVRDEVGNLDQVLIEARFRTVDL